MMPCNSPGLFQFKDLITVKSYHLGKIRHSGERIWNPSATPAHPELEATRPALSQMKLINMEGALLKKTVPGTSPYM